MCKNKSLIVGKVKICQELSENVIKACFFDSWITVSQKVSVLTVSGERDYCCSLTICLSAVMKSQSLRGRLLRRLPVGM